MHHVLFVCGWNLLRSPAAEHLFAQWPGIETAAAGTSHDADCVVPAELVDRADTILVMEPRSSRPGRPDQPQVQAR
ncbi:hypothetical protein [Luteimonas saliphila]|uniref:hypothetical protein n=1 Tax=Luteimonas saliphila TaxID=2804919 RepID=UPI00192DE25E|nr:hypothetical protein [Luteimonas saliphila]